MDNYLVGGGLIALVYAVIKFVELRWIKKEKAVPAVLIRETIIVYISSIIGLFGVDKIQISGNIPTGAFTGKAGF
tara:strand:+ start:450 stop:674 length:225 start_codon:yes stop_codon:yes gene_type:complete